MPRRVAVPRMMIVLLMMLLMLSSGVAWQSSSFVGRRAASISSIMPSSSSSAAADRWMTMRDASASYWFQVGDCVQVVEDVPKKAGIINLKGRRGVVVETWEKCNVDPTCCCAEQVDLGMAVRVEFTDNNNNNNSETFFHYFAEDELEKVKTDQPAVASAAAFDGMTCTAFKLDKLQSNKPRGIASFEPKRADDY